MRTAPSEPLTPYTPIAIRNGVRDEQGSALVLVLFLVLAIGFMATGAVVMSGNAKAINQAAGEQTRLEPLAVAGVEVGRAMLTADPKKYPKSGYITLENRVAINDAYGKSIPGVWRSTYAGPLGNATGEYGVYGTIVSVVGSGSTRAIRRVEMEQPSFARFAYFADRVGGVQLSGDRFTGPVHFNAGVNVQPAGAFFTGRFTVAGTIGGKQYVQFSKDGYQENAPRIELPTTKDLDELESLAKVGGYNFSPSSGGAEGESKMRIELVWVDLNVNGQPDEDEGFFRVYEVNAASDAPYVVARQKPSQTRDVIPSNSENCGDWYNGTFLTAAQHNAGNAHGHSAGVALTGIDTVMSGKPAKKTGVPVPNLTRQCYLGGADELFGGTFKANNGPGAWKKYTGPWASGKPAGISARADGDYLWPLSRSANPNYKGVVHVKGKVALSGRLRGKLTVAATDDINIVDNVRYATDPGADLACNSPRRDMLGLFSGKTILLVNNNLNAPRQVENHGKGSSAPYLSGWAETSDEYIDGILLALETHRVQEIGTGSNNAEACYGTPFGRGCVIYNGGVIMRDLGAHEQNKQGNLNRSAYDVCAASNPPPYYPTTGRFELNKIEELDPYTFDVENYFKLMSSGS